MIRILLSIVLLIPSFAFADSVDEKVNAIYTRMSEGYASLDVNLMKKVYDSDYVYVAPGKHDPVWKGLEDMLFKDGRFFTEMQERKNRVSIKFRVIDRKKTGQMVADVGFYSFQITSPDQNVDTSYGKFLITSILQSNGHWLFYSDMDVDALKKDYEGVKKISELKYDL